jgi:hypothetical protein
MIFSYTVPLRTIEIAGIPTIQAEISMVRSGTVLKLTISQIFYR